MQNVKKSATNRLHFFVRYAIMYCSDVQMSLWQKQEKEIVFYKKTNVFGGRIWRTQPYILL